MHEQNVVVFEVEALERGFWAKLFGVGARRTVVGTAPARDEHCIANIWRDVAWQEDADASQVHEIYSEWEPSPSDRAFLASAFPPGTKVTFSFARPASESGWDEAFASAEQVRMRAEGRSRAVASAAPSFLAVLRQNDTLAEAMVRRQLTEDLVLCLARVKRTPSGSLRVDYVTSASAPSNLAEAWDRAVTNAARGLRVNAMRQGDDTFFAVVREEGMATAILADPGFVDRASQWIGKSRFHIGWADPDTLIVWDPEGSAAQSIQQRLDTPVQAGSVNLLPTVLLVDGKELSVVSA